MPKKKLMYAGWTNRGRPFSKTQYDKSYLKDATGRSYGSYLSELGRQQREDEQKKKSPKKSKKRKNQGGSYGYDFDLPKLF